MKTYLVTLNNSTLVKIGKSKSIKARYNQIKVCNPFVKSFDYIDGDFERYLHFVFQDFRECGEWFDFKNLTKNQILEIISIAIDYRKMHKDEVNTCDASNDFTAAMKFLKSINKKK
jgi:hypothetical protein